MNEFEALTNLANGPIIFTYYAESELSRSTIQYIKTFCIYFCFLYIYRYARCLSLIAVIVIFIYIKIALFLPNIYIHRKQKTQSCLCLCPTIRNSIKDRGQCIRPNKINGDCGKKSREQTLCRLYPPTTHKKYRPKINIKLKLFPLKPTAQKVYITHNKVMTISNLVYILCTTD